LVVVVLEDQDKGMPQQFQWRKPLVVRVDPVFWCNSQLQCKILTAYRVAVGAVVVAGVLVRRLAEAAEEALQVGRGLVLLHPLSPVEPDSPVV
jgi:hypothetical protein